MNKDLDIEMITDAIIIFNIGYSSPMGNTILYKYSPYYSKTKYSKSFVGICMNQNLYIF